MNNLPELLKRWSELEQGWCELRPGGAYLVGNVAVDGDTVGYRVYHPFTEHHSLMRIQYAVQQAIVARGWEFTLENYGVNGDLFYANVIKAPKRGWYIHKDADNPATALLAAYVKALEAGE